MTTALVVDSPTPFAPPVVVKPHAQLTCSCAMQPGFPFLTQQPCE